MLFPLLRLTALVGSYWLLWDGSFAMVCIGPRISSRRKSKKTASDIVLSSSPFRGGTVDVNDDDDSVHPAVDLIKLPIVSIIDSNSCIVSFTPSAEVTITFTPPKVDMHGIGFMNKDYLDTMVVSSRLSSSTTTHYSLVVRENSIASASPMI